MEVVRVVEEAHDSEIISIAYNKARREIYTSAEGDKVIKAWDMRSGQLIRSQQGHKGMGFPLWPAHPQPAGPGICALASSSAANKASRAWDMRSGQLIRSQQGFKGMGYALRPVHPQPTRPQGYGALLAADELGHKATRICQQGHKGMVTSLCFSSPLVKLLFSGSMDNTIGIWTEKGVNLQMMAIGGPVFSLAWDDRRRYLIAGGSSVINIFKVDLAEARKTTQAQRSVASGLKDGNSMAEAPQILRRMFQPLKGPDLCHSDVVKCIIVTDAGKIISGGYDRSICIYEFDKLDKPKEALQRVRKCHTAAIVSMAYDTSNNCILTGSIDGSMKVWSIEGRLLDKFENISDSSVNVAYIASTNLYWASGRMGRLLAYDPRAPCNVTEYVKESNGLDRFKNCDIDQHTPEDILVAPINRNTKMHPSDLLAGAEGRVLLWQLDEEQNCADGRVLRWQLDEEQNCDIYQCIEEIPLHEKNIYCILYSEHLDCLITGGHDSTIQLYYLGGVVPTFNDVPLPTSFQNLDCLFTGGHESTIQLYYLGGVVPTFIDVPLPTSFQ
eukprot:gene13183-30648_t